uniref:Indolepyruvate ferredoxin oxidoreductase n=1 Tax=Desulfomonile tiedjei TaxID=2358 RepID=A0A7C4ETX5_9BACT
MRDPYNVVITGVGGQGNVLASLLVGAVLVDKGYKVTIGETYGASQRGGSVMSHVRISRDRQYGPLIPPGMADLVIALEPTEAARVLAQYGFDETVAVVNTRPVHPVDVISGNMQYPALDALFERIMSLSKNAYMVAATDKALEMGNAILANIILIGAVAGLGLLPIDEDDIEKAVSTYLSPNRVEMNRSAFVGGQQLVKGWACSCRN